ncbi:NAD(P)/FAD-dependent oxidoreductase [Candidatus Latescibacterota bacterium]
MNKTTFDLAIIGAGPAGMMAALRASECGAKVLLIEKNDRPGIKLLMTGKGRCNITNDQSDIRAFADHFGRNGRFLIPALHRFGVRETIEFFHANDLKTKVERGGRVFPESDRAKDVQELLISLYKKRNVTLYDQCRVQTILQKDNKIEYIIIDNDSKITARNYMICTGGLSYPQTGSSGDGFAWAEKMGHTIVKPKPSLTPLKAREKWIRELEGLSLKNVRISVYQDNKKRDECFGEALFTDSGLSGPIILDMSKTVGTLLQKGNMSLYIDFKPALEFNTLDKRLLRDFDEFSNKQMSNIMSGLLPQKLIPVMLKLANIDPLEKGHSVTKEDRKRLRLLLKEFPLTITGLLGFRKAIVTAGGISLKEIDPKTMGSKIISNLYFAGEILDLDGPTGGYNLQVCWSTGYVAGESAAQPPALPESDICGQD